MSDPNPNLPGDCGEVTLDSILAATNWDETNRAALRAKIVERVGENPNLWDDELSYPDPCPDFIVASLADEEHTLLLSVPATENDPKTTLYATSALCWLESDLGERYTIFRTFFWRRT
jgi:hypothetical protein